MLQIRLQGNQLDLSELTHTQTPKELPKELLSVLDTKFSWTKREFIPYSKRTNPKEAVRTQRIRLWAMDSDGRFCTCAGFLDKLLEVLEERNFEYEIVELLSKPKECYDFYPENVEKALSYRYRQEECLRAIVANRGGQIIAPPGFGKMVMILAACLGFENAKIDIVTRRLALVDSLEDKLGSYLSGVGRIGGGKKIYHPRVNIYSADSLHKSPATADILLVDEGHELLTDRYADLLSRYTHARRYTFTASPKGRFDGADIRLTAIYGKPIFTLSYQEAVKANLVVPIGVHWLNILGVNPCEGITDECMKKRLGVWTHTKRNKAIAEKVAQFSDEQVLILVDTVEHLANLYALLPDYTPVFAYCDPKDVKKYKQLGIDESTWAVPDKQQRRYLREAFSRGDLRKVIATGVWAVGVDFTQLEVVVRADGSASEITSIQVPGRVSRINPKGGAASAKTYGIVVDCADEFDDNYSRKARARRSHYVSMGWEQYDATGQKQLHFDPEDE